MVARAASLKASAALPFWRKGIAPLAERLCETAVAASPYRQSWLVPPAVLASQTIINVMKALALRLS